MIFTVPADRNDDTAREIAEISILARELREKSHYAISHRDAIAEARALVVARRPNSYGTRGGCETHNRIACERCGAAKPADQSCVCFDNGCE